MRRDLPEAVRRELDQQRKQFVTAIGAGFEELVARRIDPAPWMVEVVRLLEAAKAAGGESRSAEAVQSATGSQSPTRAYGRHGSGRSPERGISPSSE